MRRYYVPWTCCYSPWALKVEGNGPRIGAVSKLWKPNGSLFSENPFKSFGPLNCQITKCIFVLSTLLVLIHYYSSNRKQIHLYLLIIYIFYFFLVFCFSLLVAIINVISFMKLHTYCKSTLPFHTLDLYTKGRKFSLPLLPSLSLSLSPLSDSLNSLDCLFLCVCVCEGQKPTSGVFLLEPSAWFLETVSY